VPVELKVIQDFHDFMLWMINHTAKFPPHPPPVVNRSR
jgi:hypothetical protein